MSNSTRMKVWAVGLVMCASATASAEGGGSHFGRDTVGGLDGRVIKVSTLAAEGPGSLREALETKGPRLIVFEVGGVIDLAQRNLVVREPQVTIAGETAPSPGITVIRGGLRIATHDVRLQHLRFRMGDAGQPRKSGYENDVSIDGPQAYAVVVDHCSFSWGTDENLSVSGPRYDGPEGTARRVTLSHNIIAEGLNDASHSKGRHSMGTLIHDQVGEVAVIGNLYAHNIERNPWFKGGTSGVVVNNLIYNPGKWAVRLGYVPGEWRDRAPPPAPRVAVVGNFMQHGADTQPGLSLVGSNLAQGEVFLRDNLAVDRQGQPVAEASGGVQRLEAPPVWPVGLVARPVGAVREWVLRHAGARPADRDAQDRRIVAEIVRGEGRVIDSQEQVGGYPVVIAAVRRELDVPKTDRAAWLDGYARTVEGR